jgi:hypothetical protein
MQPGQPNNPGDIFGGIGREVGGRLGRAIVRGLPGGGGGGGGKGGMPGPGRPGGPSIGMPVERPPEIDMPSPGIPPPDDPNIGFGVLPPEDDGGGGGGGGGFGGLNARADGRDPFEFGEDPEFEEQRQRNYRQYPQPGNPAPAPTPEPTPGPSFQNRSQVFNNRGRLGNQYTRTRAPRIR